MGATEKYDRARRLVEEQIAQLRGVLRTIDWMEAEGISPDDIVAKLEQRSRTPRPADANGSGQRIAKRANSGESLPAAVDRILAHAEHRMLVAEIVSQLEAEGRKFPEKARRDTLVRGTLNRCKNRYDWGHAGKKPRKWFKRKRISLNQSAQGLT